MFIVTRLAANLSAIEKKLWLGEAVGEKIASLLKA